MRQLTVPCKGFSMCTVSSPSDNLELFLLCVVAVVQLFDPISEHLVGFCCDSNCAYSDTKVKVNYFELHIDFQLSKRSVIYLFCSRKIHTSSEVKSDTLVISSLLFDFCMLT